ncbi:hypothetical protein Lal_00003673, partial [Lupinus albus]
MHFMRDSIRNCCYIPDMPVNFIVNTNSISVNDIIVQDSNVRTLPLFPQDTMSITNTVTNT